MGPLTMAPVLFCLARQGASPLVFSYVVREAAGEPIRHLPITRRIWQIDGVRDSD